MDIMCFGGHHRIGIGRLCCIGFESNDNWVDLMNSWRCFKKPQNQQIENPSYVGLMLSGSGSVALAGGGQQGVLVFQC